MARGTEPGFRRARDCNTEHYRSLPATRWFAANVASEKLTIREREIAFLVARGCRDRDIGDMLGISFSTVRTHLNRAMEKKGCSNRAELAAMVMTGNETTATGV
ncbi:helix-turn-helix transcriptional regulator (plasmid) [Rhizobium sp. RCAM05350]|nr:helix-turn-helix transcriptional regulator [Rhizobium sp. RCAM05350]